MKKQFVLILLLTNVFSVPELMSQKEKLEQYNILWDTQSMNSSESMPCGGGDIGLNVWVENGDLLFYMARSGAFDENNALLKLGRVRLKLSPNPFDGQEFKQELLLNEGHIRINGRDGQLSTEVIVWVDVYRPVVHVEIKSNRPLTAEAGYESWRHEDRLMVGRANNANSYKWAPQGEVKTWKDEIQYHDNGVLFYHRNRDDKSIFDVTVRQQGMEAVKPEMYDPIKNRTSGGILRGQNMVPAMTYEGKYVDTDYKGWNLKSKTASRNHKIEVFLHIEQAESIEQWKLGLYHVMNDAHSNRGKAFSKTREWWNNYWNRSFIKIHPDIVNEESPVWQAGRNYQLMRYMLGCNALGKYPTKFNGGLFTYDPVFTDTALTFTPDHRNWGGGTHTAMNQRLVHFPMIKGGDFDLLKPQFDFYFRILRNAELRSQVYWGHKGASFTEQLENFGLPNCTEYGWNRPEWFDKGVEYNAWLEYQWDTVLEFCLMMLETERYTGNDISEYIPFIESCLTFFNEHYQYQAKRRGRRTFDQNDHLIIYPGTACETYKMAYNPISTIAALQTVLSRLLELPEKYLNEEKRKELSIMQDRIPPISFRKIEGHKIFAPALVWERINNTETPQLYPVFPWGIYGVGKPDLDIAINTWKYDPDAIKFRGHIGWKQDNIFAARMGLIDEASRLTVLKLQDSGRRFPAFWGPGFDWTPDHNWGGSGMIGLQEMLIQTDGEKIFLFPAWPKEWNVHFKLHVPYNTTVEGVVNDGKVESLKVIPESRMKDMVNML